ncbi:MAG: hypothetical protein LBC83_04305 [Oscillospiraceae bacterium]|jgi:hypothetical protein|nr:hypothetical protein [Oscillospiraceae bacterium]
MEFDFDQVSQLLGSMSEEELQNLQEAAQSLFGSLGEPPEEPPQEEPLYQKKERRGYSGGAGNNQPGGGFGDFSSMFTPEMLAKLAVLMQKMNGRDKRSDLILALKPHLSHQRQHRAEQAVQMMKMMDLLPLLRETMRSGGGA